MCCLFGIVDYGRSLSMSQKEHILTVLSRECELRGVDATGIAYNGQGRLHIRLSSCSSCDNRQSLRQSGNFAYAGTSERKSDGSGSIFMRRQL